MGTSNVKQTQRLQDAGQSLWLDNITRDLLDSGTLKRYIDDFSLTGLTSNPTIFEQAVSQSSAYDDQIAQLAREGLSDDEIFFAIALTDLTKAASLFSEVHQRTAGVDGFVSLELSPLLANDTEKSIQSARQLSSRANCSNLFIKIPGTQQGNQAIEESIYQGVAVNVTLLFSLDQYLASAEAYMRGLERRVEAGLAPDVRSVASVFLSRWDGATLNKVPENLRNKLGIAVGQQTYKAYREILASERWQRLENFGARPQRLLFASTGTKDPKASDVLYIEALAAPNTINTMPEKTLLAFADHGSMAATLPTGGGDSATILESYRQAGINLEELAADLQVKGGATFNESWDRLLSAIRTKRTTATTKR